MRSLTPSKLLLGIEAIRGLYEYSLGCLFNVPLRYISPKGDGHPVMVIPGLGTTDSSTAQIRSFLNSIGYETHPWGMGRNMGPKRGLDKLLNDINRNVTEIYEAAGGKEVSIIGWSLGGIYGREIAKTKPNLVRQVITLGTPFKGEAGGTNADLLYELLSRDKSHKDPAILEKISKAPPVPFTSLYSKTDGVVHWQCSIEDSGHHIENIEVPGASHLGLAHNPISMYIIANRLTQQKENWQPFKI
jgi:esterase/lipase